MLISNVRGSMTKVYTYRYPDQKVASKQISFSNLSARLAAKIKLTKSIF